MHREGLHVFSIVLHAILTTSFLIIVLLLRGLRSTAVHATRLTLDPEVSSADPAPKSQDQVMYWRNFEAIVGQRVLEYLLGAYRRCTPHHLATHGDSTERVLARYLKMRVAFRSR
jgi:hypothetical protein